MNNCDQDLHFSPATVLCRQTAAAEAAFDVGLDQIFLPTGFQTTEKMRPNSLRGINQITTLCFQSSILELKE